MTQAQGLIATKEWHTLEAFERVERVAAAIKRVEDLPDEVGVETRRAALEALHGEANIALVQLVAALHGGNPDTRVARLRAFLQRIADGFTGETRKEAMTLLSMFPEGSR